MDGAAEKGPRRGQRAPGCATVDAERWTAVRRAGVSVATIAAQAGVGAATVSRGTSAFGPFPTPTPPWPTSPELVSVAQAAAELAVGRHVVYDLIRRGELPAREARRGHQIERVQ